MWILVTPILQTLPAILAGDALVLQCDQQQEGAAPGPDPDAGATAGSESSDDEPVDADFEVKS